MLWFISILSLVCSVNCASLFTQFLDNFGQSSLSLYSEISLSEAWEILGPFRLGTREAVWGADPLERYGGFRVLKYDNTTSFPSALATSGVVHWEIASANVSNYSHSNSMAHLRLSFPVDWGFMQSVYGWPALQYQCWARGSLQLKGTKSKTIAIHSGGLLEFWIDGKRHFGGDVYHYGRAPTIIALSPGRHVIDLRLTRDVRALGGKTNEIEVMVDVQIKEQSITLNTESLIVSELTEGRLGGKWASIPVQNNRAELIEIMSVKSLQTSYKVEMRDNLILPLYGHQIRPLIFSISIDKFKESQLPVEIAYRVNQGPLKTQTFNINLRERSFTEPLRVTYLHSSNIVSYAILRPPPIDSCVSREVLPIIAVLHGAGVEVDGSEARGMLDAVYGICAWMLFPSGVTTWSGDDWHRWGAADFDAAVSAIHHWTTAVKWKGPSISGDIIVAGHSNGGQAAWYYATHFPDNVFAVAPVSAYTSIENYVPYSMWQISEPLLSSVLSRSRSTYKNELLLSNLAGIPVAQQHGSDDDNVPTYHSRLMHELLGQAGWPSEYEELPGKGHWFDGVMTTSFLTDFYSSMVKSSAEPLNGVLERFTITVPPTGDMGSKAGIQVDQLESPNVEGKIFITRDMNADIWYMNTRNIHRFHLSWGANREKPPASMQLDNSIKPFAIKAEHLKESWYVRAANGSWSVSSDTRWKTVGQRRGRQLGALDAILRTQGTFTIVTCSAGVDYVALQISRNFFQYFAADSRIIKDCSNIDPQHGPGNVITVATGQDLPGSALNSFPIQNEDDRLVVHHSPMSSHQLEFKHEYKYEAGLGAIFLRPLEGERLELVVWGVDLEGLHQALRLVPTITGSGQPEYVILGGSCRYEGVAGIRAAGHFDRSWNVSSSSYQTSDSIEFN